MSNIRKGLTMKTINIDKLSPKPLTVDMDLTSVISYKVSDLKKLNQYNGFKGIFTTTVILSIVLSLATAFSSIEHQDIEKANRQYKTGNPHVIIIDFNKDRIFTNAPPAKGGNSTGKSLEKSDKTLGLKNEVAGNPNPVPVITDKEIDFASLDNLSSAYNTIGDFETPAEMQRYISEVPDRKSDINSNFTSGTHYSVFNVQEAPQIDMVMLQRSVIYPEQALKRGIEGKVLITVLIDNKGRVVEHTIEYSDNDIFNRPVIDVLKNAVFQPAVHNGYKVKCYVSIPFIFKLK